MLRVGLTGGLGSGKSAAAAMLRKCGAQVSSSDEIGRALMQPGHEVFESIVEHFGGQVLTGDGVLNRAVLAQLAFEADRAEELSAIVHPAVIAAQMRWMNEVKKADPCGVAVVESALIFETRWKDPESAVSWQTRFDVIVLVTAPLEVRRVRYIQRLNGSCSPGDAAADFARRSAAQWSDERKTALADAVLRNDGTLDGLRSAVEQLYVQLRQKSADGCTEAM